MENEFFPGQGIIREFCGWSGKFGKDLENLGKVREFENKWLNLQNLYIFVQGERKLLSSYIVQAHLSL